MKNISSLIPFAIGATFIFLMLWMCGVEPVKYVHNGGLYESYWVNMQGDTIHATTLGQVSEIPNKIPFNFN